MRFDIPYVPESLLGEKATLKRVRWVSKLLDEAVTLPGTKRQVGVDALVGLLPVAGDLATAVVSLYIPFEAYRLGVPTQVVGRMLFNIMVDVTGGSVPVLGDVFDAAYKVNVRNAELLADHLEASFDDLEDLDD